MRKSLLLSIIVLFCTSSVVSAVTIDWVTISNLGNAADTEVMNDGTTGYGSVDYVYQIGKYEVTAGQYTEFLNSVAATDTYGLYNINTVNSIYGCQILRSGSDGSYSYSVASDFANRPVNNVDWYSTLRFSNWLHNGQPTGTQTAATTEDGSYDMSLGSNVVRKADSRVWLPSEDEWYKAAYHKNDGITGNYFLYPTSSDSVPGRDMTETTNPGNNANYEDDSGCLIGSPYYRTEVGEFELSSSPYGTFDMGGNVYEWNEALLIYGRGFRGGSCFQDDFYFRSSTRYNGSDPSNGVNFIGFRVASIPEPATLLLLGTGVLLIRKR